MKNKNIKGILYLLFSLGFISSILENKDGSMEFSKVKAQEVLVELFMCVCNYDLIVYLGAYSLGLCLVRGSWYSIYLVY